MFKHIIQKFHRAKVPSRELVLISSFFKEADDYSLYYEAEQAIESVFDWYEYSDTPHSAHMNNGGYFPARTSGSLELKKLSQCVCTLIQRNALPVIISNSCQSFKACLTSFQTDKTGIINLNRKIDLASGINLIPVQNYTEITAEHINAELLSLGVDENAVLPFESQAAMSSGVQWLSSQAFYSADTEKLHHTLDPYIQRHERIALYIDLGSVVRKMIPTLYTSQFDSVLNVIQALITSEKLVLIHLTGDAESLLFSRETKKILDKIRTNHLSEYLTGS
ncbi:hypothetical protein VA7868_01146 [Vibrio aerogenes CECT 7868]|uniref:Uncharacterized protein n=1 Tax=Vibrio aerogenes CECT 7868 TaxID=1216006 RepID=A0A1M5XFP1_9VIBR|nr:hypothetical protein [Vibrio aerogenes]SHH98695.1 hypothetical protein VA7868_01146 [Vibrio aerogenes CECT 7868]